MAVQGPWSGVRHGPKCNTLSDQSAWRLLTARVKCASSILHSVPVTMVNGQGKPGK